MKFALVAALISIICNRLNRNGEVERKKSQTQEIREMFQRIKNRKNNG